MQLWPSCAVGPDFHRPAAPPVSVNYLPATPPPSAPAANGGQAAAAGLPRIVPGAELSGEWWQLFHSPALRSRRSRLRSPTARRSRPPTATLAEARAAGVGSPRWLLAAHTAATRVRSITRRASGGCATHVEPQRLLRFGLSATYVLDVFGATRRTVEQQGALADLQRYQQAAAYLTLTGNVVSEALTIASTRLQIATTEELIESDRKNLALTEREFEVGTVARSDVLTADSQLASDLTQLPTLRLATRRWRRMQLAVLTGHAPGNWSSHDFDIAEFTLPVEIPLALPSQLARQRPDVLAAEAQLHAASAAVGVALAQEFPSLTLSGSLTRSALEPGALFHDFETLLPGGRVRSPLPLFAKAAHFAPRPKDARDAFKDAGGDLRR